MRSSRSRTKQKPKTEVVPDVRFEFEAIGTHWIIDLYEPVSKAAQKRLFVQVRERINTYDRDYSRFRSDSLVTQISKAAGTYTLPADGKKLFDLYAKVYGISDGMVTPLIGGLLSDAGYDATYSLSPKTLREVPQWEDVLEYDFPKLTVHQPVLLDVGAAGKGYLVDIVSEVLLGQNVEAYCINAGGDIVARTPKDQALHVGLEYPDDSRLMVGVAELTRGSICGSAGNKRAWRGFHHIMDPKARRSTRHIKAVWVYAETALLADILTTCLFFVSPAELAKHFTFEYAIIHQDNALEHSAQFPAQFFTADT